VGNAATGRLAYSSANASRVKKVMESPHFPRCKTLLTHLQEDAGEMHRELKVLRLLLSAATYIKVWRHLQGLAGGFEGAQAISDCER